MSPVEVLASYPWAPPEFSLSAFCGTWYVIRTNLALWQARTHPTISYTRLRPANAPQLGDVVRYRAANGQPGVITGVDEGLGETERLFLWRGDRWFSRFITSAWCVVDHDPACAVWAVTYFSKTLFTKAGLDIYARTPSLDPAQVTEILARLRQHPYLKEQVKSLFATRQ